ncbi:Uncharacterised protein [uncultured archaeon]|nr:Uncharacterised protein [uncultured archaeon]
MSSFPKAKKIGRQAVELIEARSAVDLISAAIKKASKEETLATVFSFTLKGRKVLAAFDLVEALSNSKPVLYFASYEGKTASFARYDYKEDSLDFVDFVGEHTFMYAKVINLAEPFPFFKK